jgi:hypothetical protein
MVALTVKFIVVVVCCCLLFGLVRKSCDLSMAIAQTFVGLWSFALSSPGRVMLAIYNHTEPCRAYINRV